MPDLADVETALVSAIATACYPGGAPSGAAPLSPAVGAPVRIRRGWPDADRLDADLAAGIVNICIFPMPGASRLTTRYPRSWIVATPPVTKMRTSVSGNTVTFTGAPGVQQLAGVRSNGRAYVVPVSATASLSDAATALAAVVPGAVAAGPVLTVPPSPDLSARVEGYGVLTRELRRQEQHIRVTLWCPSPAARDAASAAVDVALAGVDFLALPGPTCGRLTYAGSIEDDVSSKADLWRRDLRYAVDYPTVETRIAPAMIFGVRHDPDGGLDAVI